ncbi:NAD-P-binding protein [Cylindrobasidium torrendii FP15055 ss-10]|uniref:NAD-P-binding protein n=1 Tax=Cylindrobasidium torrendii FP15055 ss-10 TaxID=1314674 RepID=A0A0D7B8Y2_9AGAR|nr:NAD-P-binding protein [Cylindrobasidium torrendii FP15055 ss-10]
MTSYSNTQSKTILVIGGTGAQGSAVIGKLLEGPGAYKIRALTRDVSSVGARVLEAKGVELYQGSFVDLKSVEKALEGVYGVFVNTDGMSYSEATEIYAGIRIFELAHWAGVKHYVYSSIDCHSKLAGYNPENKADHCDAKARVSDWMSAQPSSVDGTAWSVLVTLLYMDMLKLNFLAPVEREDGTKVFRLPLGDKGVLPLISLDDIAFYVRYIFDNREETSGKTLHPVSDHVTGVQLANTFTKVTGKQAIYEDTPLNVWAENTGLDVNAPMASVEKQRGDGSITVGEDFAAFWSTFRKGLIKKDMDLNKKINPGSLNLEGWMRKHKYVGEAKERRVRAGLGAEAKA